MKKVIAILILLVSSLSFGQIYPRNYINDCVTKYELRGEVKTILIRKFSDENKHNLKETEFFNNLSRIHENLFFDRKGNLSKEIIFSLLNKVFSISRTIDYKHNENNQVIEIKRTNGDDKIIGIDTYQYEQNNVILVNQNNQEYEIRTEKKESSDIFTIINKDKIYYKYRFEFTGNLILETEETDNKSIRLKKEFEYDSKYKKAISISEGDRKYYYEYNDKQDIIKETIVFNNNTNTKHFKYKYDYCDNWVEKTTYNNDKKLVELIERKITYYE